MPRGRISVKECCRVVIGEHRSVLRRQSVGTENDQFAWIHGGSKLSGISWASFVSGFFSIMLILAERDVSFLGGPFARRSARARRRAGWQTRWSGNRFSILTDGTCPS